MGEGSNPAVGRQKQEDHQPGLYNKSQAGLSYMVRTTATNMASAVLVTVPLSLMALPDQMTRQGCFLNLQTLLRNNYTLRNLSHILLLLLEVIIIFQILKGKNLMPNSKWGGLERWLSG